MRTVCCFAWAVLVSTAAMAQSADAPATADRFEAHPVQNWVRQSPREGGPPAPRLLYEGGGVYDPLNDMWIHHAGHEGIPQTERTFVYRLATGRWQQMFPDTSPPGACCVNNNGPCFDQANRRMIRFPAGSLGHGWQMSRSVYLKSLPTSLWAYDPDVSSWTDMRPGPYDNPKSWSLGGLCSVSTYDPVHEVVVHMPRSTSDVDVYTYDVYANVLDRFEGKNPPPQPRGASGFAYDPRGQKLVMFGSGSGEDERTWFYDFKTNSWQGLDLTPRPPCKREGKSYSTHPVMAYDSLNHVMLCVVWHPSDLSHETWVLQLEPEPQWKKMTPAVAPARGASRTRNLGYSAKHNVFILEMVQAESQTPNEIWTFRYAEPPATKRPAAPTQLSLATSADSAELTWQPAPGEKPKQYRVYRADAEKAWQTEYRAVATTSEPRFADGKLESGKVHFYKVAALDAAGAESEPSRSVRTQPRVLIKPVVSVLAKDKIEVAWKAHPAGDVVGYNVYRGLVSVSTVKKGIAAPWRPNDPEYPEPLVNGVKAIAEIQRLNDKPIAATSFTDTGIDLTKKGPQSGDYRFAVYAYIVRAVNRLGTESGPSPYALTIPSEPTNVLLRNAPRGESWDLKWDASPEKGIVGYRVYCMTGTHAVRPLTPLSDKPLTATQLSGQGGHSLWVTAVDALGQEGQPSSPAKTSPRYKPWHEGEWHQ